MLRFKKDTADVRTPTKGHATDAGYDLYSPATFVIEGHTFSERINLGLGFEVPEGYVGIISERSSQGKVGLHTVGNVVDHGYTGNVHVTLVNHQDTPVLITKGDRICQLLLLKVGMEELEEVQEFAPTERGEGAHGSTGV